MSAGPVQTEFTIRRKILTLFGAKFHIRNQADELIGFSKQKAFRLKEDIRVYTDESMSSPLIAINARNVIDFSASYDVTDSVTGSPLGSFRRKGMASLVQDQWIVMDANGSEVAKIREDSTALALVRRFLPLGNLVPQHFNIAGEKGESFGEYRTHFNPFVHRMTVTVFENSQLNPMLLLAGGILIIAIEGRPK